MISKPRKKLIKLFWKLFNNGEIEEAKEIRTLIERWEIAESINSQKSNAK